MAILALDLATVTGWAIHRPGMKRPIYGTLTLPTTPNKVGLPMEKLRQFLADKHRMWNLTEIVFEAQHVSAKMDMRTVNKLLALSGMAEWFAYRIDARCYTVAIATWRKHFIGVGGGITRDEAKRRCMTVCQRFGWHTLEVDAAEACGILDCYLSMKPGYDRPWRDDLLMGGRNED